MMNTRRRTGRAGASALALAIGVASILVAGTGIGVALATSTLKPVWPNGTIHQCMNNKTFATRTVPRGRKCSAKETAYSFSQTGPKGPSGAPGLGASVVAPSIAATPPPKGSGALTAVTSATITTTSTGKIMVLGASLTTATINNTSNIQLHYYAGVYVDGVGVPGAVSISPISVPVQDNITVAPITFGAGELAGVRPGKHTVTISLWTSNTSIDYVTGGSGSLAAIATH